jgi:hypothetical protein
MEEGNSSETLENFHKTAFALALYTITIMGTSNPAI